MQVARSVREIVGAGALLVVGCDGIATVEFERSSLAFIPEGEEPGEVDLGDFDNEEGVTSDDIASAHMTSVVVEVVEPEGADLEFVDRIEVFIDAPGLARRRIAYQDRFAAGKPRVGLRLDDIDLEPYVLAETIHLTAHVEGDAPAEDMVIEATAKLDVGVTAEGACNAM